MKKLSVFLLFVLLSTMICPVSAEGFQKEYQRKVNKEYGYSYARYEDEHGRIICEYRGNKKEQSQSYTHSVLKDLGMGEHFINQLADDRIEMYANAERISSVTTYLYTDTEGNTDVVDENTAIQGAMSKFVYKPPTMEDFDGDYIYPDPTYTGNLSNTYIKITFVVTYKGNAVYHFSIDAEWLTTPDSDERYYDAIGACASYITVNNETRTGWYSYLETHPLMQEENEDKYEYYTHTLLGDNNFDGQEDHISNFVDGNWNGSGAIFSFPQDSFEWWSLSEDHIKQYSEFKAHYEFEGVISQPEQTTNFSAIASYDHCTVQLTVMPTFELSDEYNGALAFDIAEEHTVYPVELPTLITYTP